MEKVNVREIFKKKNPKMAKVLPGFVYRYIEKIIHQKEINELIPLYDGKLGLDFAKSSIEKFNIQVKVNGEDNIPREGRYIFTSNHPLGGFDGIVFTHVIGKYHSKLKFLVNDILMNLDNMDPIFIPVNKYGKQSIEYVRKIEETYQSENQVLSFPAGLCSRKIKGKIIDLEWKKSFITKAIQHKRDIVPVHIDGQNSNFFYNLSNFRSTIGLKVNIEMFYLINELFKQRGKTITLTIGKAISYSKFDKSKSPKDWAQKVKDYVYQLPTSVKSSMN